MLQITNEWKQAYPGAHLGVLALRGVANPESHPELDRRKEELEQRLRERYAALDRPTLAGLPILQAYSRYYKRFDKTYHVQLQLESIVHKGRSIPHGAALVEALFMAELEDLMLTAGHDLQTVKLPVKLDTARGKERYTLLRGEEQTLKAGDMYVADQEGVISSVIYGPDLRTRITAKTQEALFCAYAPPGIAAQAVEAHLDHIEANARLVAPGMERLHLQVYSAE